MPSEELPEKGCWLLSDGRSPSAMTDLINPDKPRIDRVVRRDPVPPGHSGHSVVYLSSPGRYRVSTGKTSITRVAAYALRERGCAGYVAEGRRVSPYCQKLGLIHTGEIRPWCFLFLLITVNMHSSPGSTQRILLMAPLGCLPGAGGLRI